MPAAMEVNQEPDFGPRPVREHGSLPEDFSEEAAQAWRNVEEALSRAGHS